MSIGWKQINVNLLHVVSEYSKRANLVLARDGKCDSPGHSATHCNYSLMDTATGLILTSNVVSVSESKNNYSMEKDGLVRCLQDMIVSVFVLY